MAVHKRASRSDRMMRSSSGKSQVCQFGLFHSVFVGWVIGVSERLRIQFGTYKVVVLNRCASDKLLPYIREGLLDDVFCVIQIFSIAQGVYIQRTVKTAKLVFKIPLGIIASCVLFFLEGKLNIFFYRCKWDEKVFNLFGNDNNSGGEVIVSAFPR